MRLPCAWGALCRPRWLYGSPSAGGAHQGRGELRAQPTTGGWSVFGPKSPFGSVTTRRPGDGGTSQAKLWGRVAQFPAPLMVAPCGRGTPEKRWRRGRPHRARPCFGSSAVRPQGGPRGVRCVRSQGGGSSS
ncbi:hypothetical protein SBRY_20873 [Actinacidiphila bryophytorum]|uniref:Uncharacterized protein n=1 Tax=Actinacidiphila bryophytorum TaxID=1436133 RepID=A0A9W4EDW9_9ACTN|nr:hypothetical protein SBRY_20873 [Actinacidiphila bryophytorum]